VTSNEEDFSAWIGKTQSADDMVRGDAVEALNATLDRADPLPVEGDPLPAMWHWLLFSPKVRRSELGPDGHPARGGFLPPIALPRRMFAGARYRFHQPLRVGEKAHRETRIADITHKTGTSGELIFVRLEHAISGENGLAIEEEHDVVYRDTSAPAQPPGKQAPDGPAPEWRSSFTPDPVVLFRYSALTFNGHRIHYDRSYATGQEGYPGLVVHGPLIATLLIELLRENAGGRPIATFRFRARRALFDLHPFELTGGRQDGETGYWLKAIDHEGALAMEADGSFAE